METNTMDKPGIDEQEIEVNFENDLEMSTLFNSIKDNNSSDYNHLKAAEELIELSDVLIKKVTKKGGIKEPADQDVIEELGDVMIRLYIIITMYDEEGDKVSERMKYKLKKYKNYLKEGKYKGSI